MKPVSSPSLIMCTSSSNPALSAGPAFRWSTRLALPICLLFSQCSLAPRRDSQTRQLPRAEPKIEWYVASKDPLTLCPRGYRLPHHFFGTYVFLADRSQRFYIPDECPPEVEKQALALREASLRLAEKNRGTAEKTLDTAKESLELLIKVVVALFIGLGRASAHG